MESIMIDGAVISKVPADGELDQTEIEQIVSHTVNTWQKDRKAAEIRRDTMQGKKAELVLENFLQDHSKLTYLSYDKFRGDLYRKHAPFDGLLFCKVTDPALLQGFLSRIKDEVADSETGKISIQLRKELEANRIYTVEIKSSSLKKRDYEGVMFYNGTEKGDAGNLTFPRTKAAYRQIVRNIKRWDYFVYPYYKRTSGEIRSFYDYAEAVRGNFDHQVRQQGNQAFLRGLMITEYENACDFYTRLYFDYQTNEIYLPGYLKKGSFYENPYIAHMPGGKSGQALYYMRSITDGNSFLQIDQDIGGWDFGNAAAYGRLFACSRRKCPNCGRDLQICNVKSKRKYCYRCYPCDAWYDVEDIQI